MLGLDLQLYCNAGNSLDLRWGSKLCLLFHKHGVACLARPLAPGGPETVGMGSFFPLAWPL